MTRNKNQRPTWRQSRLVEYSEEADNCRHTNIPPHGDALQQWRDGDGIIRMGFQNIIGTSLSAGLSTADEIDAMDELDVDVQGFVETNRPWNPGTKWRYSHMMKTRF